MSADVRVVRTRDGASIEEKMLCYSSAQRPTFIQWGNDDAKLFREELEKAHTDIAEQVMALLAGEEAEANTGPCADLQKQSDKERGPRRDVR